MNPTLKGVVVAALLAVSSSGAANAAAPEFSDLKLSYGLPGSYTFFSTIDSASNFWGVIEGLAKTKTYGQISGYFAGFLQPTETIEGANTVTKLGGRTSPSWLGTLTFNAGTISFLAAGVEDTVTSFAGSTVPVPGPEAGAGFGALAMAGVAYVAMRRRKQPLAA